jgi:phosphoserine aminotransferase
MISFYPGPSRIYDDVPKYVKAACRKGVLSMSHRSDEFMSMMEKTVGLMKEKLDIPGTYQVFFTSSATECWEIIAQSLIREKSIHLYNGAFGAKWLDYTRKLRPQALGEPFDQEALLDASVSFSDGDVICVTQNETSNGTQVLPETIAAIKKNNPRHLIAVDATSSMGGVHLDFKAADVWLASVQKCFGLPAGLGIMVCSPQAIQRLTELNETGHYNSLTLIHEMMKKWQTSCTPNVLGIYLLMQVLKKVKPIDNVHERLQSRMEGWKSLLAHGETLKPLISNPAAQSITVMAIRSSEKDVTMLKRKAEKAGFLLGEGYGSLKKETFRIANFPALKRKEVQALMKFLYKKV